MKKHILREFASFIRIETCLFITGISVAGYCMFNRIGIDLLFLFLSILLGTGASYGYNHLMDREEDLINNRRLNSLVLREKIGKGLVVTFFLLGFLLSSFLSSTFVLLYSLLILLSLVYSGLRVKKMFVIKNVFTGFTIALTFLAGSLVSHELNFEVLSYFPFIFLFGLTLNILGDIRGYEGDKLAEVKTIPLVFGKDIAKKLIYLITGVFTASVVVLGFATLYPLIPFMLLIAFFLHRDDHRKSRISILSSFIFFSLFILVLNLMGGV